MSPNDLQAAAAVISAICAILAAAVSVMVWRKARVTDMTDTITRGDRASKQHTDRLVAGIDYKLASMNGRMSELEEGQARIEQQQSHHLTARDLGVVHEKINRVAEAIAANAATTNAISEQMKTVQRYILRGSP